MTKKINIKAFYSPARKHVRFLNLVERQAFAAYKIVMRKMIEEIKENFHKEKLIKSKKPGWTGSVPQIRVDMSSVTSKIIKKYMQALRWVLMGDYAGKEARKIAKDTGIDKMIPGVIQASYLDALDRHNEHFEKILDSKPNEIPKYLIKESLDKLADRTDRYFEQVTIQLENSIIQAINRVIDSISDSNTHKAGKSENDEEFQDVNFKFDIPKSTIDKELRETVNNMRPNWERAVRGETGLASAAATHQTIIETFGGQPETRIVILTSRDERVCKFCNHLSMNPDGSFKYYKPSDFKPSGWNIGKKRDQWEMQWPPEHPNCRCFAIVVPPGFKVNSDGELSPI